MIQYSLSSSSREAPGWSWSVSVSTRCFHRRQSVQSVVERAEGLLPESVARCDVLTWTYVCNGTSNPWAAHECSVINHESNFFLINPWQFVLYNMATSASYCLCRKFIKIVRNFRGLFLKLLRQIWWTWESVLSVTRWRTFAMKK